ncbi:hypothetical protein PoB_001037500 [Plakobranchus ocellatus]|uniref:Uncharacterized protein n=1 Tax=Plakobranchus ocellatus TaxID=259542 RepID=A0AAV3YL63_9GAST|nr:hypothetical protein PoB_001037500 [Plakobranchus ocellatus]
MKDVDTIIILNLEGFLSLVTPRVTSSSSMGCFFLPPNPYLPLNLKNPQLTGQSMPTAPPPPSPPLCASISAALMTELVKTYNIKGLVGHSNRITCIDRAFQIKFVQSAPSRTAVI